MYIAKVPNRTSPPAILLRESYRENGKVKTRTLGNLSHLPPHLIELLRRSLKGEKFIPASDLCEVLEDGSRLHGHVDVVMRAMRQLDFFKLISPRRTKERDLVVAMVAARILQPQSKLATTRWWADTTLPEVVGIGDAKESDLYAAMDWLLTRQERIEKALSARHLHNGAIVLYDLTSSYFEGVTCPLAAFGHNRDRKKGKLQVNYGLLTNKDGIPVSVSVFKGNASDPGTLLPQVRMVQEKFAIDQFVLVGDRGMLTQKQIDALRQVQGIDWIGALRPEAIKKLLGGGSIQMGLFDERNLFELRHPDFPGERLVACRNPDLAQRRKHKRRSLIEATVKELEKVRSMVQRGRLQGMDKIGLRVGKVINKYKVGKHFNLDIHDDSFSYEMDEEKIAAEAALDGLYVVRTSLPKKRLSAADTVRSYKMLSQVERAFRSFKTVDLMVRPIRHRLEDRVRAHIFLCMLAYYVQKHMMEAWRPLLYSDEDLDRKRTQDSVAAATRSEGALRKVSSKHLDDGSLVYHFRGLLHHLSKIVRNTCRRRGAEPDEPTFDMDTPPNKKQQKAYELLATIRL